MRINTGCIININNNLLLLKHNDGRYSIPETELKENEQLKISCIKGVQEKTGFNVIPNAMFGVYDGLDRGYSERTLGVYFVSHLDITQENAEKLVQEFNAKIKEKNLDYELYLLSIVDISNQEFLYDHKTILNNYFRILMLGAQTFSKKKE